MNNLIRFAEDASSSILQGANKACTGACNTSTTFQGLFGTVANILIWLVGSISVIMIILGGLRYVTSGGDSKATAAAKDTILYAVIGIVVAIAAYSIVAFTATHVK
ncbi:MAG: hypothetical protein NVSMB39_1600 [Candidatus Saccharimonadales bacterium]